MDAGPSLAGRQLSELTRGFLSWLEEVHDLWRCRQRGEKVPLPGWLILHMLLVAAIAAGAALLVEYLTQAVEVRVRAVGYRRRLLNRPSRSSD